MCIRRVLVMYAFYLKVMTYTPWSLQFDSQFRRERNVTSSKLTVYSL